MSVSVYQQGGFGTAPLFPNPIIARRDPTTTDIVSPTGLPYQILQGWNNELTDDNFLYLGGGNWVAIASVVGSLNQLTGDAGTALPVAGSIQIAGGTNITTAAAGAVVTINLDATLSGLTSVTSGSFITSSATLGVTYSANTITATGSDADIDIGLVPKGTGAVMVTGPLSASTTLTAGTGITATTGNIVATAGQVNAGTSISAGTTITATLGNITATNGNLVLGTAGNKLEIAVGANASAGTATLAAGTATVLTTAVTASSLIFISRKSIGATGANPLGLLVVGTVTAGTSFVINAVTEADATSIVATDVSEVDWLIIN